MPRTSMKRSSCPRPWYRWHRPSEAAAVLAAALVLMALVPGGLQAGEKEKPWLIEADRLTFYHDSQVVVGDGKVRVEKDKLKVFADHIIFDKAGDKIMAYGNVVIHMDQDVLKGSRGSIDLATRTGQIEDAFLYLKRNNIYVTANRLEKVGVEEYHAEDATISTCPLPKQAWRFWCKDLKLNIEGDAWAKHATFDVKTIPVLYSPIMYVPINRYRKTGLLLPEYTNSDRSGFGIAIPFFLVLNDSQDMTFTGHYMSKRGWMQTIEYRHRFTEDDRAVFQYTFLSDDKDDNDYDDDGYTRGNSYRWWLRGKMDQDLPWDFEAKLDVDLVSDRDFLTEFNEGGMDFTKSNRIMRNNFGRSLAEASNNIRPSYAQVTRNSEDTFLGAHGRFNDNHNVGDRDTTVQIFPSAFFHNFKEELFDTGLYYAVDFDYTDYWRDEGSREHRLILEPSLSLPVDLFNWGDLVLTGVLEDTMYFTYGDNDTGEIDDTSNKLRYRLEADLSKTFAKVYGDVSSTSWRHSIMPRVRYLYRSDASMKDVPKIDRWDVYDDVHRVSFSLLSFVSRKKLQEDGSSLFRDMFRLEIVQNYNIEKEPAYQMAKELPRRRWSDLFAEIEFEPVKNFLLRYDTAWNHYDHRFRRHNIHGDMIFWFLNNSRLYFDYRYSKLTNVETGMLGGEARLTRSITLYYHASRNFRTKEEVSSRYGMRYQSSCWAVTAMLNNNDDDTSFMIYLELLGIGGWSPPGM